MSIHAIVRGSCVPNWTRRDFLIMLPTNEIYVHFLLVSTFSSKVLT
jgi:hypothetical protein